MNRGRNHVRAITGAVALVLIAGCPSDVPIAPGRFEPHMYQFPVYVGLQQEWYVLFIPDTFDAKAPTPLILYFHGAFQGDDSSGPLSKGLGATLREHPELYPCLVAMPELPTPTTILRGEAITNAVFGDVKENFNIDPERVYVTGASLGSKRAYEYVAHTPDIFAALMAVAGPVDVSSADQLTDLPILMAHGSDDPAFPVEQARDLAEAIEDAGGDMTYVEIAGADHEIAIDVYSDPENIEWLLSQRLHP